MPVFVHTYGVVAEPSQLVPILSAIATLVVALVAVWAALSGRNTALELHKREAKERQKDFERRANSFLTMLRHECDILRLASEQMQIGIESGIASLPIPAGLIDNPFATSRYGMPITPPGLVLNPALWLEYADPEIITLLTNVSIAFRQLEASIEELGLTRNERVMSNVLEETINPLAHLTDVSKKASDTIHERISD